MTPLPLRSRSVPFVCALLCAALAVARCGSSSGSPPDESRGAPPANDAGTPPASPDAGSPAPDAGPGNVDAGTPAGPDGGTPAPDAGAPADAGTPPGGGGTTDGGTARGGNDDAGTPPDAGTQAAGYDVVDLQSVAGAFLAPSLNNVGQVLGQSTSGTFIYDSRSGAVTVIHPPASVEPIALNDRGEVLFSERATDPSSPWVIRPFVQRDFKKTILPTFGGRHTFGFHIGPNGEVVGGANDPSFVEHAFLWTSGSSSLRDLGTLGGRESFARFIGPDGVVVGGSFNQQNPSSVDAFFWRDGKMTALPGVGGPSVAVWRASSGAMVGQGSQIFANSADVQPLLWSGGNVRILAKLPGDGFGGAAAINAAGDIVGFSDTTPSNLNARAVLWRGGGDPVRIDSLAQLPEGLALWHGVAINESGQILAFGGHKGEGARYFLLTPRH